MKLAWQPRAVPLAPVWVVARGAAVAEALAARLAAADDATLAALVGVAGTDLVAVGGASDTLPWVDGVAYLGIDAAAPRLRLPTTLAPGVPVDWLERALARGAGDDQLRAVLPGLVVPLGAAREVDRAVLAAWRRRQRARSAP